MTMLLITLRLVLIDLAHLVEGCHGRLATALLAPVERRLAGSRGAHGLERLAVVVAGEDLALVVVAHGELVAVAALGALEDGHNFLLLRCPFLVSFLVTVAEERTVEQPK